MTKKKPVIEFYDNAENLPIRRFQKFNKYLMIDIEVGTTFEDYDNRTYKAIELLNKQMYSDAVKELTNRRQMVYQAFEEYSPKHYALALMVKSINGVPCTGMSETELDKIIDMLQEAGYTEKELCDDLADVKKKSTTNWKCIFQRILKPMTRKTITY